MFLNTIGFICVSLCSLLFSNNRQVVVDNQDTITREVMTSQNWSLYSINTEIINKGFIDALFEYNEQRFGASSENMYFDIVDLALNADVGEYCDFYCGASDNSSGRGIWGYHLYWNDFNPEAFNDYNDTSRAIKYFRLTKLSSATNHQMTGYVFKEFTMSFGFYGINNNLLNSLPFDCNMYYSNTGAVGDFYVINNNSDSTRFILSNYNSRMGTGDVIGSLFLNFNSTYRDGYNVGYQYGYNEALELNNNETAYTIFSGIMGIALVPINMFLNMFNFEVFGINLAGFVSGILTVAVIVIILRLILGGKNNDK